MRHLPIAINLVLLVLLALADSRRISSKKSRQKCKRLKSLPIHPKILQDFDSTRQINFVTQQIRHLQANVSCQNRIPPTVFLNLLYHHHANDYSIQCIAETVFPGSGYNSACLTKFVRLCKRYSKSRSSIGSHLMDFVYVRARRLQNDLRLAYKTIN